MNIGLLLAEIALTLGKAATEGHITKREAVDFVAGAADAALGKHADDAIIHFEPAPPGTETGNDR